MMIIRLMFRRTIGFHGDCQSMFVHSLLHLLLLTFELLTCDKLEYRSDLLWIVCFIPLLTSSLLSFSICLWTLKNQRSFLVSCTSINEQIPALFIVQIHALITMNFLFFVFVPLRLDSLVIWRYTVSCFVFILAHRFIVLLTDRWSLCPCGWFFALFSYLSSPN
jgi:hypothetical protein